MGKLPERDKSGLSPSSALNPGRPQHLGPLPRFLGNWCPTGQFQGKRWKAFDLAIDLLANGKADLGWMVSHKFPLADYQQALDLTHKRGSVQVVKIAFEYGE